MTIQNYTIAIDDSIFDEASAIFEDMGLDLQTAVKMFMKKTIKERRLPFELSAGPPMQERPAPQRPVVARPETQNFSPVAPSGYSRPTKKITHDMCVALWHEFKRRYASGDRDLQSAAHYISNTTGMSRGSAYIYFYILYNLVEGEPVGRGLKYQDLEFFVTNIITEFSDSTRDAVIASLAASIPYWEEKLPGSFAEKVKGLLEWLKRNE